MKTTFPAVSLAALLAFTGPAQAQERVLSLGEQSGLQACQYACKPGAAGAWKEVTTLSILNVSSRRDIDDGDAAAVFVDGSGNFLAASRLVLPRRAIDELNICRTLQSAGISVPEDGLVYLLHNGRIYTWRNNHIGRFLVTEADPSAGRVRAVSESECRVVSQDVENINNVNGDFGDSGAPLIPPVIVGAEAE